MLRNLESLIGYKLQSKDGEIGVVRQFYFDDQHWAVRYLIADTGTWLTDRQVLISPYSMIGVNSETKHIIIDLTKKQIEDSPPLETDKPVSRQFEESYYGYYGLPMYWVGPYMWGAFPDLTRNPETWQQTMQEKNGWDPHLRSSLDATGHEIQATDGTIGHVEDFILDDSSWAIRYLVIDTRNWLVGKRVLISPHWIDRMSWREKKVYVALSRDTIKLAPEYTPASLLSREYEKSLHSHYNLEGYWIAKSAEAKKLL